MLNEVDIDETLVYQHVPGVIEQLLKDHTTQQNIFWGTDSYVDRGEGFQPRDFITIEHITGGNEKMIRPRSVKSIEEQAQRVKDKAEVFTPSWVCNAQNNLIDEAWFGRPNVFNTEYIDEKGIHSWRPTEGKIEFDNNSRDKNWKKYVRDIRLEVTCGEAPYLVSRYDTVSGEPILDVMHRIGILDRKLRVVSENTDTTGEWLEMAQEALKATYGFEWQGDSLLLAREALYFTVIDFFKAKFDGKEPIKRSLEYIAYIISWNIWQMDGLKLVVPESCNHIYEESLWGDQTKVDCPACQKGDTLGHIGQKCLIRDWKKPKDKQKITFASLLNANQKD